MSTLLANRPAKPALTPRFTDEIAAYVADSYPRNHNYRIVNGQLRPNCRLSTRNRKLQRLIPASFSSLLDICCSKGYFVLSAAMQPQCERALGLDVIDRELEASRAVKAHLEVERASFERLRLHELAERIDEFGGPFEVAMLVNAYQYLYFGSMIDSSAYFSHDEIFRLIRTVCDGRLIFNNRTELHRCQDYCKEAAQREGHEHKYSTEQILDAASKYFTVNQCGRIGRYPLWSLDAR